MNNEDFFDNIDADLNHYNELYPDLNNENKSNYYTSNAFNELSINRNDFSIFHHNIRSLNKNYDQINGLLSTLKLKFDILCFSESWLNDSNQHQIHFENFNSFHSLRPEGNRGGGTSIFVSNRIINVKKILPITQSNEIIESLFTEFSIKSKRFIIGNIYKPIKSNCKSFTDKLIEMISSLNLKPTDECIITGDFNIDLLKSSIHTDSLYFINSMFSCSFLPLISKPTRISENSATLIDNIFISNPVNFNSGIILTDISEILNL